MRTYTIIYPRTTITYAELSDDTRLALLLLNPEQHFVSEENVTLIRQALDIENLANDELTYVRNAVVNLFSEIIHNERILAEGLSQKGAESKTHWQASDDATTRMSMITAVIDNEKYKRGLAV